MKYKLLAILIITIIGTIIGFINFNNEVINKTTNQPIKTLK